MYRPIKVQSGQWKIRGIRKQFPGDSRTNKAAKVVESKTKTEWTKNKIAEFGQTASLNSMKT